MKIAEILCLACSAPISVTLRSMNARPGIGTQERTLTIGVGYRSKIFSLGKHLTLLTALIFGLVGVHQPNLAAPFYSTIVEIAECAQTPDSPHKVFLPVALRSGESIPGALLAQDPAQHACYLYDPQEREIVLKWLIDPAGAQYAFPKDGGGQFPFSVVMNEWKALVTIGQTEVDASGWLWAVLGDTLYKTPVLAVEENTPPEAGIVLPTLIYHGEPQSFPVTLIASDYSGIKKAEAWLNGVKILSAPGTATVHVPDPGEHIITYRVEDNLGYVKEGEQPFTAYNLAPIITQLTNTIEVGQGTILVASFIDPNGDSITYQAAGDLPSGYELTASGLVMPKSAAYFGQSFGPTLTLTDTHNGIDSKTLVFEYVDTTAPQTNIAATKTLDGTLYTIKVDFTPTDNNATLDAQIFISDTPITSTDGLASIGSMHDLTPGQPATFQYGLAADRNQTIYHAVKVIDPAGLSAEAYSGGMVLEDHIAPGTITDLGLTELIPGSGVYTATLGFSMPPDVEGTLTAKLYRSTSEFSDPQDAELIKTVPLPSGTLATLEDTLSGEIQQTFHFRVQLSDGAGNQSLLSNQIGVQVNDIVAPEWLEVTLYDPIFPTLTQIGARATEIITNATGLTVELYQHEIINGQQVRTRIYYNLLSTPGVDDYVLIETSGTQPLLGYNEYITHEAVFKDAITDMAGNPIGIDRVITMTYGRDPYWILHRYDQIGINYAPQWSSPWGMWVEANEWRGIVGYLQDQIINELGAGFFNSQLLITDYSNDPMNPELGPGHTVGVRENLIVNGVHYDYAVFLRNVQFGPDGDSGFYVQEISESLYNALTQ